ncbi:MAG: hypothetical protein AAFN81_01310, partial [Bacteroidota bacterium]
MQGISFAYPTWLLIVCLLAGLAYALVLYFRDRRFKEAPSWLTTVLGIFRFLAVSTIAILLLSPILRSIENRSQKPVIVFAQDGSESVTAAWSSADSTAYIQDIQTLQNSLAEKYD